MHDISYLHDILILLFASVVIIIVFKQLGLSPALGYLVAGAAIGPFGFGIVTSTQSTRSLSELGIVFLLFAIGLELTIDKLIAMKKYVLGFGSLQVLITSSLIAFICYKFADLSMQTSIVIGAALAMSSTAIVMQVIEEHSEQSTRVGRLSFSILLMQDLAVIPVLVLLPLFAGSEVKIAHALGKAFLDAIIAMAIIIAVGRLLLRPTYRMIASSDNEVLFLSFTLIVILGSAFLSSHMGLSFALGAFVAGLMVAETEYKHRVEDEIVSIKSLLLGLFFMSIGMSFDFDLLLTSLPYIVMISILLIITKASVIVGLCKIFRFPFPPAIHTGLLLSQGGEFAFIVFLMAVEKRLMDVDLSQFLMTVVTFTMALTPLVAGIGRKIKSKLYSKEVLNDSEIKREIDQMEKHVIVIGFSRIGHIVSYVLRKSRVNHIILENNHRIVRIEKSNGYNIYYGDSLNLEMLKYIGIERCESVVIALQDEEECLKATSFIHDNFPDVKLITKSESESSTDDFKRAGATCVISKNLEIGLQLSQATLVNVGIDDKEINNILGSFRDANSESLKDMIKSGKSLLEQDNEDHHK